MRPAPAPTPVLPCPALGGERVRLWVKNDGATHPVYGGNKARKAGRLVEEARRRDARRILTSGPAGSHHVLAMTLAAREHGLLAAAALTPAPHSEHAESTLRAALGQGLVAFPTRNAATLPLTLLAAHRPGDYVVPPGGSNVLGAGAYLDAVGELASQVRSGALPEPDVIVVPVGSGGTCAGLLAGIVHHGLRARLVGVEIAGNPLARRFVLWLARRVLEAATGPSQLAHDELAARFELDLEYLGAGYGRPTPDAASATEHAARELGLTLDDAYTAKAFARTLSLVRRWRDDRAFSPEHGCRTVLYWHTLSAAPLEPLLDSAPAFADLPRAVRRLFGAERGG